MKHKTNTFKYIDKLKAFRANEETRKSLDAEDKILLADLERLHEDGVDHQYVADVDAEGLI